MSIDLEEEEPQETQWALSDDIELDEMCSEYRRLESNKKLHESAVKEIEPQLKSLATRIQDRMGGNKAVRTSCGYMLQWIHYKRKGYTVPASEGERWQLRSPF